MKTTSLKPNKALIQKFEVHREGVRAASVNNLRAVLEVEAEGPVTTYLLDDMGLEDFKAGKAPKAYVKFDNRRFHQAELNLPDFSRYYLVIENGSAEEAIKVKYNFRGS